ncbi:MAG: formate dehydrogenase subunit gamma [bacterium]
MAKWGRRAEDQEWFIRLNRAEVWQHNIIWVTFLLLVLTGMMSLVPTTWVTAMFGNYAAPVYRWRRILHFFFAFWLFVGCVWHICYLAFSKEGRQVFLDILLKPIDFIQMKDNFLYMLGMRPHPPKFERYDYKEKLEYLFGAIGTTVIFITGTIMTLAPLFPKFVVEVAATFHLMEATLASFAISIWHFYAVHLKPGKFPQDTSWLDGKMTMHHLKEEHPAYYERVVKEREAQKRTIKEEPKFVLREKMENATGKSDIPETGNKTEGKKEPYREEDDL